jgi:hypothetical protein
MGTSSGEIYVAEEGRASITPHSWLGVAIRGRSELIHSSLPNPQQADLLLVAEAAPSNIYTIHLLASSRLARREPLPLQPTIVFGSHGWRKRKP